MSPAMRDRWMTAFASHVPPRWPLAVLDLGCGIGRFTPALADTFGGPVYGVEPSARMRQIAAESTMPRPCATWPAAPRPSRFRRGSCDVVLMRLVIHHVEDLAAGVAEIGRVLRPGGRVLIRNTFADRMRNHWWYQSGPGGRHRAGNVSHHRRGGRRVLRHRPGSRGPGGRPGVARQQRGRIRRPAAARPFSTFEHLTEDEIAAGMAALDAAVASETQPHPIEGTSDLLVLG